MKNRKQAKNGRSGRRAIEETSFAPPIAIRSRTDVSSRLEREVRAQVAAHLAPYASLMQRVTVRFDDVNGPKGGADIDCEIKVVISRLPSVIVTVRGDSPATAFAAALPRLVRAVRKDLDRHDRRARRTTRKGAAAPRPPRAEDATSLIDRGVGRGPDALKRALERPEKVRRDALIDTSAPGVSASDRRAGGQHSARRNSRAPRDGMTVTLEDSVQRPSRKSTRRSANGGKPSQGKERNAVAQLLKPSSRAARAAPGSPRPSPRR
jgi:hypothetical protein